MQPLRQNVVRLYYCAWAIVLAGFGGSLYFSEIRHFPPCDLCWYQRILLYPLVLLIPIGILRHDRNLPYYVMPLTLIGAVIALYQHLLQVNIIHQSIIPCTTGVPCGTPEILWFGVITIPLLSFIAFYIITISMYLVLKTKEPYEQRR